MTVSAAPTDFSSAPKGVKLAAGSDQLPAGGAASMTSSSRFRGLVRQLYERDFPTAQSVWVEEFLLLLVELRGAFGNDLDKIIILSLIGQQMLRDPAIPAISHSEASSAPQRQWRGRDTNIDALARASRIPRESVRRKVNELIADEMVERMDSGGLAVRAGIAARLAPSTMVSIAMLDAVFAKYLGLLRDHDLLPANVLPTTDKKGP
jgi:hypothetical protein